MPFASVLRPLLLFSNLFGLGPFITWRNGVLLPKKNHILYAFKAFIPLFIVLYLVFADLSGASACSNSPTADFIDTFGFATTCLGAVMVHVTKEKDLRNLYNRLLQIHANTDYVIRGVIFDFVFCIAYETTFPAVTLLFDKSFKHHIFSFYVLETVAYVVFEVYNYLIFLHFVYLVQACRKAFKNINLRVQMLVRRTTYSYSAVQNNGISHALRGLASEHAEIVQLCRSVNQLFGVQNLLSICLIFLEITYAVYNGVTGLLDMNDHDRVASRLFSDVFLWAGYFIYKLLVILTICTMTIAESEKTIPMIQELALTADDRMISDEVEYFSLQFLHCKPVFDALGLFPIDMSLMYSIIGAATGYLIILMQFRLTGPQIPVQMNETYCL